MDAIYVYIDFETNLNLIEDKKVLSQNPKA